MPVFARNARLFSLILLVLLAVAMGLAAPAAAQTSAGVTSADGAAPFNLGVVLQNPGEIDSFEAEIGRHVDIFLWYQSMDETLDTSLLAPVAAGGRSIQLSWEPIPHHSPVPVDPARYRLQNFTRGDYDIEIRRWARELRDFGYPVLLRPMCEMNGDWTSWSGTANGNSPADYIPAWRHMHDIFIEEGAYNVDWLWSPNRDGSTANAINTFDSYYPGDAYVDYVGFSGYNWGTMYNTPTWISSWQGFEEVFGYSYDVMASRTNKPIVLAEMASTELGGNKAQWITDAFAMIPTRFPRIVGVTWFNLNKECDWRVQSSPSALQAFRAAINGIDAAQRPCGIPGLTMNANRSYWANYSDYGNRFLTVDFTLANAGPWDAYNVNIYNSWSTNGVAMNTALPLFVGNLPVGQSSPVIIRYAVPVGVTSYYTSVHSTANDYCGAIYRFPRMNSSI
ncbi:MAG: glycoside hydrolase family 26 protein [Thermoleophilia bacterium]